VPESLPSIPQFGMFRAGFPFNSNYFVPLRRLD
jgi:hypothetical protein